MNNLQNRIIGTAGSSLKGAAWASSMKVANIGCVGEQRTEMVLNKLAQTSSFTVLHDVRIPIPGVFANIDHVIVSGNHITLIDSKMWKPGFYWTLRGKTFRGWERFTFADKKTLPMAKRALEVLFARNGISPQFTNLIVVWSVSGKPSLHFYSPPESRALSGFTLERAAHRILGQQPANQHIVDLLSPLVYALVYVKKGS